MEAKQQLSTKVSEIIQNIILNYSGLELKERKMERKDKKRRARRAEEWSTCLPYSEEDYEEDDDDDNTTRGEERDCIRCGGG